MDGDAQAPAAHDEPKNESEDEALVSRANDLMAKITSSPANPSPKPLACAGKGDSGVDRSGEEEIRSVTRKVGVSLESTGFESWQLDLVYLRRFTIVFQSLLIVPLVSNTSAELGVSSVSFLPVISPSSGQSSSLGDMYMEEVGHSSISNGRASHNIGKLGNLVRDNDEFFELISSRFLSEARYSTSVRAAAARLLLSCSTTWVYPHVFEDDVLENIKNWAMDDNVRYSVEENSRKHGQSKNKPSDAEMLRTYTTGLLSVCLSGGGQVVEDVLTSGLPTKLMHYLRIRVLGETSTSQKDVTGYPTDVKGATGSTCARVREESRSRVRQVPEASLIDIPKLSDEGLFDDQNTDRDQETRICARQLHREEDWGHGGELCQARHLDHELGEGDGIFEADENGAEQTGEDARQNRELRGLKAKYSDRSRSSRDEDAEENARDDSSRRRANRAWSRLRGRAWNAEGVENDSRAMVSPGSGVRSGHGRNFREKNVSRNAESKGLSDAKKHLNRTDNDEFTVHRDDTDERFRDCKVGARDILDLVKKATRAAEAEAMAAGAPAEAVKAAGDAAADLVKGAALEVFKSSNDEEAAVLAASTAASTVVDAANATEVSRVSITAEEDTSSSRAQETEAEEILEGYFILDNDSLAQLREKHCILCLEILGEYVEVLGPVLHEKGVDVCLALLQRSSRTVEDSKVMEHLPGVLKLICALAAHRKFAALFVDRGGMQKLLVVPRVAQTFFGLSSCLFTIGSLQGIMERVCALPSEIVHQVVELALQLLECTQDQARKNAAIFFAAAFVFRAVLDAFEVQEGLQKLLNLLHGAASVRSGGNSGAISMSSPGLLRNDRSPAEVLTASEKQVAYHTCVALRQFFRAHLLLLVDSLRPNKSHRSVARSLPSARAAYKPLDISNEAMDAVFIQIQRDRKLGPAFVRARWPAVDKFLNSNGHVIVLELCQAPPVERYLHDLAQYALGVLHIVTFVPYSRKLIVNATLSNDRVGMAVILDAVNNAGYVDPEVIQPALNVLVNLVCPPPSISNKSSLLAQGQPSSAVQTSNGIAIEAREKLEKNTSDRSVSATSQNESRERNVDSSERSSNSAAVGTSALSSTQQAAVSTINSGVVGDRRISLGAGAGCAGLAAQLEQGYYQAREAVRANNGIKVLLHLLHSRIITPPANLDCLRALACRVLLGLARDDTIAHILTKLQVGKKLSELIRDSGCQTPGSDQGRWQAELAQVAIELIAIVTNSGRASTLAATDAAAPTLRRIERAAIAAATPITYHSRELLLLIHEHLQASGLTTSAASLLKEAQLIPLPSLTVPPPLLHQTSLQETQSIQFYWPSGRAPRGFFLDIKSIAPNEANALKCDQVTGSSKKKPLVFSPSLSFQSRNQSSHLSSANWITSASKNASPASLVPESPLASVVKSHSDAESQCKTPIVLPMKRKLLDSKDTGLASPGKRLATSEHVFRSPLCQTPNANRKSNSLSDVGLFATPSSFQRDPLGRTIPNGILSDSLEESQCVSTPGGHMTHSASQLGVSADSQTNNPERVTLDSLVVQYLKHQHRQCPAPITTLPPLSLLHPHTCPESRHSFDAPANVTARLSTREFRNSYGGIHGNRRDRQFVYSRFRPWRTCRDDSALLTCLTFLGDSSQIATGSHSGELKIFDTNSGNMVDSNLSHQSPVILVQSALCGGTKLVLSSGSYDVKLWDASSITGGPLHSLEGCKAARFSNSGLKFAALGTESSRHEVLLYDSQTYNLELRLNDSAGAPSGSGRGHVHSQIHFSPSDSLLLYNGVLWDQRVSGPVRRFDQFTDYGGGGFHPSGNEVIINSEVWDLRKFKLLRSVPSLDQTVITFNAHGDIVYAILRRNLEDITSAVHTRRVRHPLFPAFRTVDAVNYSDIATVTVDRCVLDFATEPADSFVGMVTMDDQEEMFASARLYEIGRRRPTDDDSDPDDAESDEEEEEEDESEGDEDPLLGPDLDADIDSDIDDMSNDDDDDSADELEDDDDEDGDFTMDDVDFDTGGEVLEIVSDGEDDDSQLVESFSSGDEGDFAGNGFGF
ncbi:hypothetical protein Syun_017037 [Stephania yunnanensis]|uniref:LisH domain-containing protein n=1 Tax=Stephania yunnanensis TaxID=152371 RepID=A0AAP0J742_9MAGN